MSCDHLEEWSERPGSPWPAWTFQVLSDALGRSSRLREYSYEIVVQGSYANKTNIRAYSDVDLVVQLKMPFAEHVKGLEKPDKARFEARYEDAAMGWREFRQDVIAGLRRSYFVSVGDKCLDIKDWDSLLRIPADIVPALEWRRYREFSAAGVEKFDEGIYFEDRAGHGVISYPKQHLRNGNRKDAGTGGRFKQVVRIVKNARHHLMDPDDDQVKALTSYFIECLFFNVPDHVYRRSTLEAAYRGSLRWLRLNTDLVPDFLCQNGLVGLFADPSAPWSAGSVDYLANALPCCA